MANKSGYFTDQDGNKLLGATLGENVFLSDGTDLETKLNNIVANRVKYVDYTGTTTGNGNLVAGGSGTFPTELGVVVNAVRMDAESIVSWYQNTYGTYLNFHIVSPLANAQAVTNTEVTVRVYYIPS